MNFDEFVEKICLHNKLVPQERLGEAKTLQAKNPGLTLLEILFKTNLLDQKTALQIKGKYSETNPPQQVQDKAQTQVTQVKPQSGSSTTIPSATGQLARFKTLEDFLLYARELDVSDLFLNSNCPPMVRKFGRVTPLDRSPFHPSEIENLIQKGIREAWVAKLHAEKNIDTCIELKDGFRYRTCILKQKDGYNCSFRIIPKKIRTVQELGLPPVVEKLTHYPQGLILVTGPAGSGKTTTMAALVEMINQTRQEHIITLEDPIEYIFEPKLSQVSQRSVGDHTKSFSAALRGALREDPDIIMIGEIRDFETASLAISASETGHLVIASLQTNSAMKTVSRLLDIFPPDQQGQIRGMISESIRGIITQKLIPHINGDKMCLALEIMLNNSAISNVIKKDQLIQLQSNMQIAGASGMLLMDQSIHQLHSGGFISGEEAFHNADVKTPYKKHSPEEKILAELAAKEAEAKKTNKDKK